MNCCREFGIRLRYKIIRQKQLYLRKDKIFTLYSTSDLQDLTRFNALNRYGRVFTKLRLSLYIAKNIILEKFTSCTFAQEQTLALTSSALASSCQIILLYYVLKLYRAYLPYIRFKCISKWFTVWTNVKISSKALSWVSKVILSCIGFVWLCFVIGLKKTRATFSANQKWSQNQSWPTDTRYPALNTAGYMYLRVCVSVSFVID